MENFKLADTLATTPKGLTREDFLHILQEHGMEYGKAQRLIASLRPGNYDSAQRILFNGRSYRLWTKHVDGKEKVVVEEEHQLSDARKTS